MASCTFSEPGTDATQDLSFWAATAGTVASATDQQKTGPCSIKLSLGAGPTLASVASPTGALADAGRRISFAVRFDTLPAAAGSLIQITNSTSQGVFSMGVNTDGTLFLAPVGATLVNATTVLAVNTWYVLGVSYTITNTTTFRFDVFINGVVEATATAGTLTRTASSIFLCRMTTAWGASVNGWYDDIYIDDGSDYSSPGLVKVTNKRPNANGTANNFTTQIGVSGSGYGTGHSPQVNEQPLSQTNGWSMIGAGAAVTEEYNVEGAATGDVSTIGSSIINVAGWIYSKALVGETGKIVVDSTQTNVSITTTAKIATQNSATPTVFPAGSGTDIGIITDTSLTTVSLYECGILVAFVSAGRTSKNTHPWTLGINLGIGIGLPGGAVG